jgi:hypothetical protein
MPIGRLLIVAGAILLVAGLLLIYTNIFSYLRLGHLPGDIRIKRDGFQFYFPITTCIVFSLIFSIILYLLRK